MMRSMLSVLMPIRDAAATLEEALASLSEQQLAGLEVAATVETLAASLLEQQEDSVALAV